MLENPRFSTVKLKNISIQEVFWLPSNFDLYIRRNKIVKKLELHFDLCENKSYSTFEAEAGLFYAQKSIEETVSFLQIKNV